VVNHTAGFGSVNSASGRPQTLKISHENVPNYPGQCIYVRAKSRHTIRGKITVTCTKTLSAIFEL